MANRDYMREAAERAKVDPDLMTAIDPSDLVRLLDHLDRMEAVVKAAVQYVQTRRDVSRAVMPARAAWQADVALDGAVDAYLAADRLTKPGAK